MDSTALFVKYENMIHKAAHKANRQWGVDYDDLVSQGFLIFCEAFQRHDPAKGSFSTFLFDRLRTLNDYCISLRNRKSAPTYVAAEIIESAAESPRNKDPLLAEHALSQLDDDPRRVLQFLLDRSWEKPGSSRKPSLSSVTVALSKEGWGATRVREAWLSLSEWWRCEGALAF